MSEPFIGEIKMFAGNFAPRGWSLCNGQLLPISQNSALFSILGTIYGGDGRTTFALPDLRGRAPMHPGDGPNLSQRSQGERVGVERVTLTASQLPPHVHPMPAASTLATDTDPKDKVPGAVLEARASESPYTPSGGLVPMNAQAVSSIGGGQPHENMQPFIVVNFIIALQGTFPSRN